MRLAPINSVGESSADPLQTHMVAVTRLANTIKFIGELITADANDSVTVVPHDLLAIVFRLLQVRKFAVALPLCNCKV